MRWLVMVISCSGGESVEQRRGCRWRRTTDALVAVGADVVVAWQRSQRFVKPPNEQMAVGVHAVPPPVAATSLRQMVPPHATACYRAASAVLLSHSCTYSHTTPLSQHVGDSTSNSSVQALSVSLRIHPSLPATAQRSA